MVYWVETVLNLDTPLTPKYILEYRKVFKYVLLLLLSMKTKCQRCGYEWETNSNMVYVNCPSCRSSVKIRDIDEKR